MDAPFQEQRCLKIVADFCLKLSRRKWNVQLKSFYRVERAEVFRLFKRVGIGSK